MGGGQVFYATPKGVLGTVPWITFTSILPQNNNFGILWYTKVMYQLPEYQKISRISLPPACSCPVATSATEVDRSCGELDGTGVLRGREHSVSTFLFAWMTGVLDGWWLVFTSPAMTSTCSSSTEGRDRLLLPQTISNSNSRKLECKVEKLNRWQAGRWRVRDIFHQFIISSSHLEVRFNISSVLHLFLEVVASIQLKVGPLMPTHSNVFTTILLNGSYFLQ